MALGIDEDDLMRRAYAAWFRGSKRGGYIPDAPNSGSSAVQEHDGKLYVVLRNVRGVLQVYRVRNDGKLKALRRWPRALEEY